MAMYPSLHLIEDNLYLGELAAATDKNILDTHKITHILTVDIQPLPSEIRNDEKYVCKFIAAEDRNEVDLLSHFPEAIEFIDEARKQGHNVLVHCFFGVSRSATLVCAYLMQEHTLNSDDALALVKEKRSVVGPNNGFLAQLALFSIMGWRIDPNNLQYRHYKLFHRSSQLPRDQNFPEISECFAKDPLENPNIKIGTSSFYKCRNCRRLLFTSRNILPHDVGDNVHWTKRALAGKYPCPHGLIVEPMKWMEGAENNMRGKIQCPKCGYKLGSFSWLESKCTCGSKCKPIFYISKERIDECPGLSDE